MKKIFMVSVLVLVLSVVAAPVCGEEMAKEGKGSGTLVYMGTINVLPLDKEHFAVTYDVLGGFLSDTGKGPFHNMSTRNIGVINFAKGVGKLQGYIVMTAPDGDKVLCELKENKTLPAPNPNQGTIKFIGGTGKFAGIKGGGEYTRYYIQPAKKGTITAVSRSKTHWKLP